MKKRFTLKFALCCGFIFFNLIANAKYLNNNSIMLNPQSGGGFQVSSGAIFEAKIQALTGCN